MCSLRNGVRDGASTSGTVANRYGIYIGSFTGPATTDDFGLHQAGGAQKNYFAGNLGLGNLSPSKLLHVGSVSVGTGLAVANFQNADGICTITPASVGSGIACSSDERLKENFQDVTGSFALDRLLQLQAVTYNFKTAPTESRRTGYKAQDVQKVAPEFVRENEDGLLQVYYDAFIPWITEAIKILDRDFRRLRSENAMLKTEVEKQKQENAAIKSYLCGKDPNAVICK